MGPVIPELAINTLMYPSAFSICETMDWRESFDVTSPWRGMMFPCFFKEISITCLEGRKEANGLGSGFLEGFLPPTNDVDFCAVFFEGFGHH